MLGARLACFKSVLLLLLLLHLDADDVYDDVLSSDDVDEIIPSSPTSPASLGETMLSAGTVLRP